MRTCFIENDRCGYDFDVYDHLLKADYRRQLTDTGDDYITFKVADIKDAIPQLADYCKKKNLDEVTVVMSKPLRTIELEVKWDWFKPYAREIIEEAFGVSSIKDLADCHGIITTIVRER